MHCMSSPVMIITKKLLPLCGASSLQTKSKRLENSPKSYLQNSGEVALCALPHTFHQFNKVKFPPKNSAPTIANGLQRKNLPTTVGRPPTDISLTPGQWRQYHLHRLAWKTCQFPGKVGLKHPGIVCKVIFLHLDLNWFVKLSPQMITLSTTSRCPVVSLVTPPAT